MLAMTNIEEKNLNWERNSKESMRENEKIRQKREKRVKRELEN